MTPPSHGTRILLHLLAGGGTVLAAILADPILSQPRIWGPVQCGVLGAGLGIAAIGWIRRDMGMFSRATNQFCLSLLGLFLFLAVSEGFFRAIRHDFSGEEQAWLKLPVYYRQPMVPTGSVFFKRPGSEHWTGQPRDVLLKYRGVLPNPYTNEPVISVEYDRKGFRNPDRMADWEIAVAGDSFTELGYLDYDQLFTSIMARMLDVPVLNLGASYTGPLTQLSYLRDYGIAASTKHAMIVFFEGNDLEDLATEYDAWVRWRETGQRDFREFQRQPSLVRALNEFAGRGPPRPSHRYKSDPITAYFKSAQGDIPITLSETPPGRSQLSPESLHHLDFFFRQFADFGKERNITVWLTYMPDKRRVLHDEVEFSAHVAARIKKWQPTDLPEVISGLCNQHGIQFVDLTPALIRETKLTRQLMYNSIYETHLSALGSLVVGRKLVRQFPKQDP